VDSYDLDEAGDCILAAIHGRGWAKKTDARGRVGAQLLARGLMAQWAMVKARAAAGAKGRK